jgi:hypothetical protein
MMLAFCQLPKRAYPLRSHPARSFVFSRESVVIPPIPQPSQGAGGYDPAEHRRALAARRRAEIAADDAELLEILSVITPLL